MNSNSSGLLATLAMKVPVPFGPLVPLLVSHIDPTAFDALELTISRIVFRLLTHDLERVGADLRDTLKAWGVTDAHLRQVLTNADAAALTEFEREVVYADQSSPEWLHR